jgi:hypothetical protein
VSSAILSIGLESGGAGKHSYNCMTFSGVGDGVESRTERSGSLYMLELGVSARGSLEYLRATGDRVIPYLRV